MLKRIIVILSGAAFFAGCTRADVEREVVVPPAPEGTLVVNTTWTGLTGAAIPTEAEYYLYKEDGSLAVSLGKRSAVNMSTKVAPGKYKLIAVNSCRSGAAVRNWDNYGDATVYAEEAVAGRALSYITEPRKVHAVSEQNIVVEDQQETVVNTVSKNLTKTVDIEFDFDASCGEITHLKGSLQGVYPYLLLSTGLPTTESKNSSTQTGTKFDTDVTANNGAASVEIFGILDPRIDYPVAGDPGYQSVIQLELTKQGVGGAETQNAEVDITDELARIIDEGGQADIPVSVEVKIEFEQPIGGQLKASVTMWAAGSGGGEV